MPPRPRLTTGPLPTTTTIYKTVQCLFIGTMGNEYHTQRREELNTFVRYITRPARTRRRTQNTETSAAAPARVVVQSAAVRCEQGGNLLPDSSPVSPASPPLLGVTSTLRGDEEELGRVRLGQAGRAWKWEKGWEKEQWLCLPRCLVSSLQGLFALVLTAGAGSQNPLHKVLGPPGN